ncbi:FAD-binding oxidoreductase [Prochlorococcus marinus]|uniref:FAD/FMN-containing dehydrogenase n=1 Tax=Prochlorococcus marinus (strain MIT 9303) TaxID=59922 RepID=A2CB69_PROM3|nr:FAD/FMN-containing dehydrogenase [Prochlorococcus marinus str. MIT 9303]
MDCRYQFVLAVWPMTSTRLLADCCAELTAVADLELIDAPVELKRFSRDAYDFSPVLREQLEGCCADVVVRPHTVAAVAVVAGACTRHGIPLTLRGSGTGNYGQCVPLQGGVVMLMGALSKVRHLDPDTGVVTVESGCLLRDLDQHLSRHGRQLRLLPSSWRSASVGGFVAGGSGGIGSVRWGFLRDPGHLLALEVVTAEDSPQQLQLDAAGSEALNHAYGSNGIITALSLATAPAVPWQEVMIDCEDWSEAVALALRCTRAAVDLHLCSLHERPIVDQLPHWCGASNGQHRLLLLVAPDGVSTLKRLAAAAGAHCKVLGPEADRGGTGLRELTWNHTTMHMRAVDPDWTYLQMLLPQPELAAMQVLKQQWGDDLLWHLEAVRQQGVQRLAALPIVRWRGRQSLEQLMNDCRQLGAVVFNPHVITVEDGGLGVVDADQVAAKRRYDPKGLLNPGKLRGWL